MFEFKIDKLIRTHRKTIGLQITSDARLIVRAPYSASEDFIYKLISRKGAWIRSKQDHFKERQKKAVLRRFIPGEEFLFLGQPYILVVIEDLPKAVVLDSVLMVSSAVLGNARDHLENWYKARASEHINQRVEYYARTHGLEYRSVRINEARTRWGSCGHTNKLNFTWRLVMAPPRVVDYVVIHELMHTIEKNHSRRFWDQVARLMPDYKQEELWLKMNGYLLSWV